MAYSTNKKKSSPAAGARKTRKKAAAKTARKTTRRKTSPVGSARAADASAIESALGRLEDVTARLDGSCQTLAGSLGEVPTPADFEPLAEHLYQLARYAPRLLEALEALQRVDASVKSLQEVSETLQYVHSSFDESLLRLPRAEDYEPLAGPLREFARVSPALAESLAAVLRTTTPLADAVRSLRQVSDELRASGASRGRTATGAETPAPDSRGLREELERADGDVAVAHSALREALGSLPEDPAYKRVAEQLREIASVSPSLLEWLSQVDPISRPLGASVQALRASVERLEAARERLGRALDSLGATRSGDPG